jgi:hypothetical protein
MSNKVKVYLDDVRTPEESEWVVVRDYHQFVNLVNKLGLDNIDIISLDHDLGDTAMVEYYNNVKDNYSLDYNNIKEKTGYDCCKFLVNKSIDDNVMLPLVYIHSANPIGSSNMMGYINNYLKNCRLPQTCVRVEIPHTIDEHLMLSPEVRESKWKRKK